MDLNADVGEGYGRWRLGEDEALLAVVTSANVACGFHAGDPALLRRTCELAAQHGVAVGAQVGYPDLAGFGRRFLDIDPDDLTNAVLYQIGALDALARAAGTRVAYVKPHGALYNATVTHEAQAAAVVDAVATYRPVLAAASTAVDPPSSRLPLLGLPGSALLQHAARAGLRPVREFFADRAYAPDGSLLPRSHPSAVLTDAAAVAARCARLLRTGEVVAVDGSVLSVAAESVCVHGDTPAAATLARAVRAALEGSGAVVGSFVAP